jgi:hypothetical protein
MALLSTAPSSSPKRNSPKPPRRKIQLSSVLSVAVRVRLELDRAAVLDPAGVVLAAQDDVDLGVVREVQVLGDAC